MQACGDVRFVFDYRMKSSSRVNDTLGADQVYRCKNILGWKEEDAGPDFAIIELDRPVTGKRRPLRLSSNRNLRRGTKLTVIGHPAGLPTKITDGAAVRTVQTAQGFFVANLDTYGGNSGSAVFNDRTLQVEGILVRGEEDFRETQSGCIASYRVRNNAGRGEDVTLVSAASENGFIDPKAAMLEILQGLFGNN
jgi:V8-like Glu-specific endopeptidase